MNEEFKFIREKYNLYAFITPEPYGKFKAEIHSMIDVNLPSKRFILEVDNFCYEDSYEDAELKSYDKLVEIIKIKNKIK